MFLKVFEVFVVEDCMSLKGLGVAPAFRPEDSTFVFLLFAFSKQFHVLKF